MKKWEKRRPATQVNSSTSSPLPTDYLRLVEQTMTTALEKGLTEIKKTYPVSEFYADGALFGDEAIVSITLSHGEGIVIATTIYASADYNPLSEKLGLEPTLAACVDAIGSIFDFYLDPASPVRIAQIANQSLGAMEDAPFEWTRSTAPSEIPIYVKMDKSNPRLEQAAEDWLMKNDPEYKARKNKEDAEAQDFLNDRLEAIKKARNGSSGDSGPIRH